MDSSDRQSSSGASLQAEWLNYRPGTVTSTGETILELLQVGAHGVVFLNSRRELNWEYDDSVCANGLAAEGHATGLIAQIGLAGLRGSSLRRAQLLIATGLSSVFEDNGRGDISRVFDDARTFLLARHTEALQTAYILAVFIAGVAIGVFGLYAMTALPLQVAREFALSAAAGALGAVLSVSQRFRSIPIDRYASRGFTVTAGVSRVVFGALFGLVFLMFQRSGLILAAIESNSFAISTAALVAGFSERLIPELIGTVESKLLQGGVDMNGRVDR